VRVAELPRTPVPTEPRPAWASGYVPAVVVRGTVPAWSLEVAGWVAALVAACSGTEGPLLVTVRRPTAP